MKYQHTHINGDALSFTPGKAVCIGRNYVDHIKELNNPIPKKPILFNKPSTAFCEMAPDFTIPDFGGQCHHELELSVLIGSEISAGQKNVIDCIWGLGLGLDLTLRELQSELKSEGHPWEIAKGFNNACPLTPFIPISEFSDLNDITFQLSINGTIRQDGHTSHMITNVEALINYSVQYFTLLPGDILLTGTPAGVSALTRGDKLDLNLDNRFTFQTCVTK